VGLPGLMMPVSYASTTACIGAAGGDGEDDLDPAHPFAFPRGKDTGGTACRQRCRKQGRRARQAARRPGPATNLDAAHRDHPGGGSERTSFQPPAGTATPSIGDGDRDSAQPGARVSSRGEIAGGGQRQGAGAHAQHNVNVAASRRTGSGERSQQQGSHDGDPNGHPASLPDSVKPHVDLPILPRTPLEPQGLHLD
jgi:hypothetical protein